MKGFPVEMVELTFIQPGTFLRDVIMCCKQEAADACGGIANGLSQLRAHDFDHRLKEQMRREVLTRATFGILRVLFKQTFVDFAFGINIQTNR